MENLKVIDFEQFGIWENLFPYSYPPTIGMIF